MFYIFFEIIDNRKGFVIAQVLAVVGIVVLLSAVTLPFLNQYQPTLKLRGDARTLVSNLRYTQQLTISEQKVYYLEMDTVSATYSIVQQDNPNPPVKIVTLDPSVNFQSITGLTGNKVVYNSYGAVSEAGLVTLINSQGKTMNINIRPSGYIQLQQ